MSGWKTFTFNSLIGFLVLLGELADHFAVIDWSHILPPGAVPYAVLGIGVVNIVLRHITREPAGWISGRRLA